MQLKDITIKNVFSFFQGNIRYGLFKMKMKKQLFDEKFGNWENSNLNLTMSHTQEQFIYRIYLVSKKSPTCLNGQCYCGCDTPALFLADKGCEGYKESNGERLGPCYTEMMSKEIWESFKQMNSIDIIEIFNELKTKKYV